MGKKSKKTTTGNTKAAVIASSRAASSVQLAPQDKDQGITNTKIYPANQNQPASTPLDPDTLFSQFPCVGACLASLRKEVGMSLEEAAELTKVKLEFLEAIENSDYSALPALPYAVGFVKIYADALNQDAPAFAAKFRAEMLAPDAALSKQKIAVHPSVGRKAAPLIQASPNPKGEGPSALAIGAIIAILLCAVLIFMAMLKTPDQIKPDQSADVVNLDAEHSQPVEQINAPEEVISKSNSQEQSVNISEENINSEQVEPPENAIPEGTTTENATTENAIVDSGQIYQPTNTGTIATQPPSPTIEPAPSQLNVEEVTTASVKKNNQLASERASERASENDTLETQNSLPVEKTEKTQATEKTKKDHITEIRGPNQKTDPVSISGNQNKLGNSNEETATPTDNASLENTAANAKTTSDRRTENVTAPVYENESPIIVEANLATPPSAQYPNRCITRAKKTEKISVVFDLTLEGKPTNTKIVTSTNSCFNRSALRSMQTARFNPRLVNGSPVKSEGITLTISFDAK